MRKITQLAINAFLSGTKFKLDNTEVKFFDKMYDDTPKKIGLFLHGNCLATREIVSGKITINDAHWKSNTTKERLNGIPGVSIIQRKGVWYLNGEKWFGEWTTITEGDNA